MNVDRSELRYRTVRAAGATLVAQGLGFALQLLGIVVLSRLLSPTDFGLVAMVTTFSLLLASFGQIGFPEAIVQKGDIDQSQVSNLFWTNAIGALILSVAFASCGRLFAAFYGEPRVTFVTLGVALTIFLTNLSIQHLALLKRAMLFTHVSMIEIAARAVSLAVSIVMAYTGWTYWSLVAGAVALPAVTCAGAWVLCRWVPSLPQRNGTTAPLVLFALNTYGRFSANYIARNLDNLLLGWLFGPQSLGFYKRAYDLFVLPANQLSNPLTTVMVLALRRLALDPEAFERRFVRVLSTLAFIGLGLGTCLTLVGKDLIFVLLGRGWNESGRIFTYFGPGIGMMLLYATHGWLHLSIGRADRWLRWSIVELTVTAFLFLLGIAYGAVGLAIAWAASFWILTAAALWYAGRPIGLNLSVYFRPVWRFIVASGVAALAATILLGGPTPDRLEWVEVFIRIGKTSSLFLVVYLAAVSLLHRGFQPIVQVTALLQDMVRRPRRFGAETT